MVFYVNGVKVPDRLSSYYEKCVGLFTNNSWKGECNFCGWYNTEYYLDTTLVAYGVQLVTANKAVQHTYPFDGGVYEHNIHYDKIQISSGLCEEKFEASSVEEAIKIFKEQRWEQFAVSKNE